MHVYYTTKTFLSENKKHDKVKYLRVICISWSDKRATSFFCPRMCFLRLNFYSCKERSEYVILECTKASKFPSLTISLAEAVCFSVFSHSLKSLHHLLVGMTGCLSEPCAEHLSFAGLRVSGIVLLDHFQLCILHPQL